MKSTNNRKTILGPDVQTFKGYRVNSAKSGLYREILEAIIGQAEACFYYHKRLLIVRFELKSYAFATSDNNAEISQFMKRMVQWITRRYKTTNIGRVWVRERERSKRQHYHGALLIDGDKVRHPKLILAAIEEKWTMADPSHIKEVWRPSWGKPYHFADKRSGLDDAVYRLSYLAKPRGKGYRPDQAKDYGTSRIKAP